ncbi:MAG: hypothetical protein IKC19_09885 [Bacteroidales bacterium]|nr:hypothetical protein [Bacteroidales bacterium]
MKRLLPLLICLTLMSAAFAQRPGKTPAKTPTLLSVADIAGNYGLDTAWINDTAGIMRYLDEQPQDYVELTNFCVSVRTKAQKMLSSLENDYPFRDSLIWIDSNTVISDYSVYEFRLRRLADLMGKMSIRYSRLEQQRIEAEKEAARQRAIEEARRQQEERNRIASDLRSNIELHHRAIITACDGAGISDKAKLKELKDLYYSYLMVYNKYDLSTGNATNESINRLDELNSFQNDLLENVVGQNSLPYQIENFKNVLKMRCEKDNGDVYRSYTKVFKHTSVPVSFADVKEYEEYVNRMRTVINVQQRYLQTLDLRATIASGTEAINTQYGKKYKQVLSSYRDVYRGLNTLPAFTTNAESVLFIESLEDFVAAQQRYIDFFSEMEEITTRGDTIKNRGINRGRELYDVVVAYRDIEGSLLPIPSFSTTEGADLYEAQLEEVRKVQQCYLEVLDLREVIARNDDTITNAKKLDRTLANGYRLLRRQVDLKPNFSAVERGRSFIDMLRTYIELQQLCVTTMHKLEHIRSNAQQITSKDSPYRNIGKAYSRMEKAYSGIDEITNAEDLRRYSRQCDYILEMQDAFFALLRSQTVADADAKLKKDNGIDKIKLIVGLE